MDIQRSFQVVKSGRIVIEEAGFEFSSPLESVQIPSGRLERHFHCQGGRKRREKRAEEAELSLVKANCQSLQLQGAEGHPDTLEHGGGGAENREDSADQRQ